MKLFAKPAVVCASLLALALTPLFASADTPEETFKAQGEGWSAAYNAGNADAIVAKYANNGVLMPPNAPAVTGHDAMKAFLLQEMAGAKKAGISLHINGGDAGSSGDTGWHSGTFSVSDKDGNTVATGKFVEVWRKQDDKWVMIRDIWNNDAPAPPPAPEVAAQ